MQEVFMFPASFTQKRLWFLDQMNSGTSLYNIADAIRIVGPLDVKALNRSVQEVVQRHESLRTCFRATKGEPQQVIAKEINVELPVIDLRSGSKEQSEADVRRRVQDVVNAPFDLQQTPLWRIKLFRMADNDHVMATVVHHIIFDAWSMAVLWKEISLLYAAFTCSKPSPLPELSIQYADFSEWQRTFLRGKVLEEQLEYWKTQLAGTKALNLPFDRPRPSVSTGEGGSHTFRLEPTLSERLRSLSRQHNATLYMTLLAAFQALLFRYTGQEDIAVGSAIAGRTRPEVEELIGFFVNTLVLRTKLSRQWNFHELLLNVKATTLDAYEHQDVPFDRLVQDLAPQRNLKVPMIFQVTFNLQNVPRSKSQLGRAEITPFAFETTSAKFDISAFLVEAEDGISLAVVYNQELFESETIAGMFQYYLVFLQNIVEKPDQRLTDFPFLRDGEKRLLLTEAVPQTPEGKPDLNALVKTAETEERTAEDTPAYVAPRNSIEKQLAEIWADTLEVELVGVHDNFFKLGGHSMLATLLVAQIIDTFHVDLPVRRLFEAPTIAQLAQAIEQLTLEDNEGGAGQTPSPILVEMQEKGAAAPLFCVHPVGGHVFCYADLAKALGEERPFYALQAPSPEESSLSITTIEEMANLYLREIRRVQPHGPYLLGGWSIGGVIAWQMAKQIRVEGEAVGMLALIDSNLPLRNRAGDKLEEIPLLTAFALDLCQLIGKDFHEYRERFSRLEEREQYEMILHELQREGILPQDSVLAEKRMKDFYDVFRRNARASREYQLTPMEQEIVVYQASERESGESLGEQWVPWSKRVSSYVIPGNHFTILKQPNVFVLADLLRSSLQNVPAEIATRDSAAQPTSQ
jgi:thioesterase domain-containing protein/NRPS condensation-like uncharacterized protein/acyl carrier protein